MIKGKSKNLAVWLISHSAFLYMAASLIYDYNLWKEFFSLSGFLAFAFLVLTLSISPLSKIKSLSFLTKSIKYKRALGVASFSYAFIHLSCFVIKRITKGLFTTPGNWIYFLKPAIIPALFIAFPILLVLAITSNDFSVKKLSFKKWKKLHQLVYIAQGALGVHLWLVGNKPLLFFVLIPLTILQLVIWKKQINSHKMHH